MQFDYKKNVLRAKLFQKKLLQIFTFIIKENILTYLYANIFCIEKTFTYLPMILHKQIPHKHYLHSGFY